MKKFHVKRLLKLASHLETIPRKEFYIGSWQELDESKCGTTACALGHACFMKEFKRIGLSMKITGNKLTGYNSLPVFKPTLAEDKKICGSKKQHGYHAAEALFGLSYDEADSLFSSDSYNKNVTPKTVAKKIRRFVKAKMLLETVSN
jgi:hypothetical protein